MYLTIKYAADGNVLWTERYNGPGNYIDWPRALALDHNCNVIVTGTSYNSDNNYDYTTIKYGPDGGQLWFNIYNGPGNSDDDAYALAVDQAGCIYVTGYSLGSGTAEDIATLMYDPAGQAQWCHRYNYDPADSSDYGRAMAIDNSGNLFVTGTSYNGVRWNGIVIKYDSVGNVLWANTYDNPNNTDDEFYAIAVDSSGHICVAGNICQSISDYDYLTIRYYKLSCGDVNDDEVVDIGDIVYLISYVFYSGPEPVILSDGDANADGVVDLGDIFYLVHYVFYQGYEPYCF